MSDEDREMVINGNIVKLKTGNSKLGKSLEKNSNFKLPVSSIP